VSSTGPENVASSVAGWGKLDKVGYEEWEIGSVSESEFVRVLAAPAAEIIRAKETEGPVSEALRTSSSCVGRAISSRGSRECPRTSS